MSDSRTNLHVRPLHMYIEDVRVIICRDHGAPGNFMRIDCGGRTHAWRCGLHRRIGLTPEQSAKEFIPYIDALKRPLRDDSLRNVMRSMQATLAKRRKEKS